MDFNKLADSTVKSGFYAFSFWAILLLISVSAVTEGAFLYLDTVHPLIDVWFISALITVFFVLVIEGINYFALKTFILSERDKTKGYLWFLLFYAIAKGVSLTISVGGALAAVEIKNAKPYEITEQYKDSITMYYNKRIEVVTASPHAVNSSNISKLESICTSILAEIENIKKDKGNYNAGGEFLWSAQMLVKRKTKTLEANRASINKIITNDSGVTNAEDENAKLRYERDNKLSEIDSKKSVFDNNMKSKGNQAWLVIGMIELFSLMLNGIRTYTNIYKTPSVEDTLTDQEREWKLDDKRQRIILRMEKAIIYKYIQKRITENSACAEIGKLRGNSSINKGTFKTLCKEHAKGHTRAELNGIEQDSTK